MKDPTVHAMPERANGQTTPAITPAQRQELRDALRAIGAFERHPWRAWRKWLGLLAVTAVLCAVPLVVHHPLAWLSLLPGAVCLTAAAMLGHEGAHKSMASSSRHNAWMLHLTFPLLGGLGAHHWKWKHNQLHHVHPNVPGLDFDLQMWPMASHAADYQRAGAVRQVFIRHVQAWVFWPLSALLPYAMRLNSLRILVREARARGIDRAWWLDAGCLAVHYVLWIVIPAHYVGIGPTLAYYFALWSLVGLMLSLVFAPAHIGLPLYAETRDDWLGQLATTRNLTMPKWLSFFFIGLDYQVEHHLFPGISHFALPAAARETEAWARRHGLPYKRIGYGAGIVDVTRYLARAWRVPTEPALGGPTVQVAVEAAA